MKREIDKYQVSLKAFIKNEKGEILALKALETGTMAEYYDFPGGRIDTVEFGTPFTDILAREIAEECGEIEFELSPKPVALARHRIPAAKTREGVEIHVLYVFFEAWTRGGDVTISE
jgi:ADP-ribose pyrophosphatase YjhB (NUDIX family)